MEQIINDNKTNESPFSLFKWKTIKNNQSFLHPIHQVDFTNSNKQTKNELNEIIDNSKKYIKDTKVMTEWGIGKIVSVKTNDIAIVNIEGAEAEFPLCTLKTSLQIYCYILCKDQSYWADIKVGFDYTINILKKKVSHIVKCHPSQIIIVHAGKKIDKNDNLFEALKLYEKDTILCIIKDPQELFICRTKHHRLCTSSGHMFNAIGFKVNQDIVLTGVGFYKNNSIDVTYDLYIYEEDSTKNTKLIYSEKKIVVKCEDAKQNEIFKYKIPYLEMVENVCYQIHQYIVITDSNQNVGFKCSEEIEEKKIGIGFKFFSCSISNKINSSDIDNGMIPSLYFFVKTDI